jgi:hypothetical protein
MFGDLDAGVWGIAWVPPGGSGFCTIGAAGATPTTLPAPTLDGFDPELPWQLSGDGVEVEVVAESAPAALRFADADIEGFEQLCRVRGAVAPGGVEHAVDCLGRRSGRSEPPDAESIRELAAWFDEDEGLALVSVRRTGAAGHGADAVSAVLFEAGHSIAVAEPRLSTTYGPDGTPIRASLELWLASEEGDEDAPAYPRRAAGEAAGQGGGTEERGRLVRAELFRWHMRGRTGIGVYQLIRAG